MQPPPSVKAGGAFPSSPCKHLTPEEVLFYSIDSNRSKLVYETAHSLCIHKPILCFFRSFGKCVFATGPHEIVFFEQTLRRVFFGSKKVLHIFFGGAKVSCIFWSRKVGRTCFLMARLARTCFFAHLNYLTLCMPYFFTLQWWDARGWNCTRKVNGGQIW